MNIDEQMFDAQKRRERYGVWRSVDGVFWVERVRIGDGYGAVVVAAEKTPQQGWETTGKDFSFTT